MSLGLIWAQAHDRVIGRDNAIPWHLPEDLAHFKRVTASSRVVMGRRTWESLPPRFRPLPGRQNVVITSRADWSAPGAAVAHSLDEALATGDAGGDTWVIGGAAVYAEAMRYAHLLAVTEIDLRVDGDTYAPVIGPDWICAEASPESGWLTASSGGPRYRFLTYRRA